MVYLFVGITGAIGAVLRYLVGLIPLSESTVFPFPTLIVNLFGCFLLAWLTTYLFKVIQIKDHIRTAITTGLIGSFTTFSTFSVEVVELFQNKHFLLALIYILVSILGGLLLSYLGFRKLPGGVGR